MRANGVFGQSSNHCHLHRFEQGFLRKAQLTYGPQLLRGGRFAVHAQTLRLVGSPDELAGEFLNLKKLPLSFLSVRAAALFLAGPR